jgi:hypothetical protein
MSKDGTTNILLTVIAVCLVLIVARMYGVDKLTEAHSAQANGGTRIAGCFDPEEYGHPGCGWTPIRVDKKGFLILSPEK